MLKIIKKHTEENQIVHHGITWLCYWAVIIWVLSHRHEPFLAMRIGGSVISIQALIFYFNLNVLLPKLLEKKRFWGYFLAVLGVIFSSYFIYKGIYNILGVRPGMFNETSPIYNSEEAFHRMHTGMTIASSLSILFISTIYKTIRDSSKRDNEQVELKNKQLESEMKFLKSQINPHFLFNALNNIYTLAQLQSENTPEIILKLSDMMRYMLYESNTDTASLQKEIKYIENYISIHQLKEDGKMNIVFDYDQADTSQKIAPLVLLPFFENSFKHGNLENLEKGRLKAILTTDENEIFFSIENSKPETEYTKDKVGGVGLVNVERRLELLYPKRHILNISNEPGLYKIELRIQKHEPNKNVQNPYCRRRATSA